MLTKLLYKNIAISGEIGTGTTTLSALLSEELNWQHLNTGEYFRKWHKENNLDLEETKKIPPELDRKVDMDFQELMKKGEGIVFEARLAGWLAKDLNQVFKILLLCDFNTAMERVSKREGKGIEEVKAENSKRSKALLEKFKELYGVENYLDPKYFDLVIDTTNLNQEQVLEKVIACLSS